MRARNGFSLVSFQDGYPPCEWFNYIITSQTEKALYSPSVMFFIIDYQLATTQIAGEILTLQVCSDYMMIAGNLQLFQFWTGTKIVQRVYFVFCAKSRCVQVRLQNKIINENFIYLLSQNLTCISNYTQSIKTLCNSNYFTWSTANGYPVSLCFPIPWDWRLR